MGTVRTSALRRLETLLTTVDPAETMAELVLLEALRLTRLASTDMAAVLEEVVSSPLTAVMLCTKL